MQATGTHLLYIINTLDPGGTERLAVDMGLSFASEFRVSVICLDRPGLWSARLRAAGIPVHCVYRQPGLDFGVALDIAGYCRQHRVDIIHAHQCTPWFYSALSRLLYGRPRLLLEEHGRFYPEVMNRKRVLFNKHLIRPLTQRFVAVSEDVKQRLVTYEGLDPCKIEVVYNGVSPAPRLDAARRIEIRRELGIGPDEFLVGTAGRFDPIKNYPMLMESISKAGREVPAMRGLLLGNGPIFDDILTMRDKLGLSQKVIMPGHRDDARDLIQCMDLFVLSSLSEGTSMALLEAMAAAVPVAVTAVGGNPEVVIGGKTGWVVPSRSVDELTRVIVQAATNHDHTRQLADAGYKRFEEKFTFDHMIENYRKIYYRIHHRDTEKDRQSKEWEVQQLRD